MTPTTIDELMAYESEEFDEERKVKLFQELVDNGMAWELQGRYGREAVSLIQAGLVKATTVEAKYYVERKRREGF